MDVGLRELCLSKSNRENEGNEGPFRGIALWHVTLTLEANAIWMEHDHVDLTSSREGCLLFSHP